jgi:hypothetical protein
MLLPRISSVRMQGVDFCVVSQFERTSRNIECFVALYDKNQYIIVVYDQMYYL